MGHNVSGTAEIRAYARVARSPSRCKICTLRLKATEWSSSRKDLVLVQRRSLAPTSSSLARTPGRTRTLEWKTTCITSASPGCQAGRLGGVRSTSCIAGARSGRDAACGLAATARKLRNTGAVGRKTAAMGSSAERRLSQLSSHNRTGSRLRHNAWGNYFPYGQRLFSSRSCTNVF